MDSLIDKMIADVANLDTNDQVKLASHCIEVAAAAKANGHYAPVLAETALDAMTDADRDDFLLRYAAGRKLKTRCTCAT